MVDTEEGKQPEKPSKRVQKLFRRTVKYMCRMHDQVTEDTDCICIGVDFLLPGCTYVLISFENEELTDKAKKFISLIMDLGRAMLNINVHVEVFLLNGFYQRTAPWEKVDEKELQTEKDTSDERAGMVDDAQGMEEAVRGEGYLNP